MDDLDRQKNFLKQKFPTKAADPLDAEYVWDKLQDRSYLVCMSPTDSLDEKTAIRRCGLKGVRNGDFLINADDHGQEKFINTDTLAHDVIEETKDRPDDYLFNLKGYPDGTATHYKNDIEFTNEEFYGVPGYYAPLLYLDEVHELEEGEDYSIHIEFNTDKTFKFIDGASGYPLDDVCVQKIASTKGLTCKEDYDAGSPGKFHPYYDHTIFLKKPKIEITIE